MLQSKHGVAFPWQLSKSSLGKEYSLPSTSASLVRVNMRGCVGFRKVFPFPLWGDGGLCTLSKSNFKLIFSVRSSLREALVLNYPCTFRYAPYPEH